MPLKGVLSRGGGLNGPCSSRKPASGGSSGPSCSGLGLFGSRIFGCRGLEPADVPPVLGVPPSLVNTDDGDWI